MTALLEACLDSTKIEVLGEIIDLVCCSVIFTASSLQKLDQVRSLLNAGTLCVRHLRGFVVTHRRYFASTQVSTGWRPMLPATLPDTVPANSGLLGISVR